MVNVQLQEIPVNHPAASLVEMFFQILHGLGIDFYHLEVYILTLKEILRQHPHTGTYLQYIHTPYGILRALLQCRHDSFRNALVCQEMLPQSLFSTYFHIKHHL